MTVDPAEIEALIGLQLGREQVIPGDRLVEDLGAESGDFVTIIAVVEERYGIVIDEMELVDIVTVGDLYQIVAARTGSR